MKIVVTGGAGFIGSNVVDAFLSAGHEVVVIDNLSTGYRHNINPSAKFYEMDICSSELTTVLQKEEADIICHHAAQASVPVSVKDPLYDANTNVMGFINLLQGAVKNRVKKVIFISSGGALYGEADEYPTTENYQPVPLSVYAINKMVGEIYLQFYKHQYGLDYTVLRYANVYGPRQVSHGEAGVVSIFIEKLLRGETPTINRYEDQPNGMIRDYVFVQDVVKANLAALEMGSGEAFNIGTCLQTSTQALYDEICRQLGVSIKPNYALARLGDLRNSLLNYDKATKYLGWTPSYNLASGIAETIKYFKNK